MLTISHNLLHTALKVRNRMAAKVTCVADSLPSTLRVRYRMSPVQAKIKIKTLGPLLKAYHSRTIVKSKNCYVKPLFLGTMCVSPFASPDHSGRGVHVLNSENAKLRKARTPALGRQERASPGSSRAGQGRRAQPSGVAPGGPAPRPSCRLDRGAPPAGPPD